MVKEKQMRVFHRSVSEDLEASDFEEGGVSSRDLAERFGKTRIRRG